MGPTGYPKTSVTNYQSTEHTIPEQERSNLYYGGSLKSCRQKAVTLINGLYCKAVCIRQVGKKWLKLRSPTDVQKQTFHLWCYLKIRNEVIHITGKKHNTNKVYVTRCLVSPYCRLNTCESWRWSDIPWANTYTWVSHGKSGLTISCKRLD